MKRSAGQEPGTRHPQRSRQAETAEASSSLSVAVQPVDLGIDDDTLCVDSDTTKATLGDSDGRGGGSGSGGSGCSSNIEEQSELHAADYDQINRDIDNSGCPLADLCHIEDLWEHVCSQMSGDALSRAARVPVFCLPTRRTPAFIFLAGVNNDAEPVPWHADNNVLSVNFNPWCSRCNRTSCHHHGKDWDRHVQATKASERMLHEVALPAYLQEQRKSNPSRYVCSGPARPPTPWKCADSSYEPLEQLGWDHMQHLYPPVYGIRPGFTFAPFWNVLVEHHSIDDEIDSSDYSASDYL